MMPAFNFMGGFICGALVALGVVVIGLFLLMQFGNAMGARSKMNMTHMLSGFSNKLLVIYQQDVLTKEDKRVLQDIWQYIERELDKWRNGD